MKLITAQILDRWIGIPVCFLLSVFEAVRGRFFRKAQVHDPERILFIGLSEIGSNVLACGAIKKAREMFPQARLYFLIFKENQEILEILGIINAKDIFTIRNKSLVALFVDTLRFFCNVKREKIEVVVDLELFSRFSGFLAYMSGATVRVGFYGYAVGGLYRGSFFTHQVQFNQQRHIALNFMALVRSIAADPLGKPLLKEALKDPLPDPFRLEMTPQAKGKILEKLKSVCPGLSSKDRIVVLNPEIRTRLPLRSWPAQYYRELAEKLLELPDVIVVVIGLGKGKNAVDFKSDRCIQLAGKTSLRELIDLFHISRLMVSHDSGVVHLASLTDIETVVLFGPETPLLYGPLQGRFRIVYPGLFCSPCFSSFNHRTSVCRDNQCMKGISVDEVFELVRNRL
jgi:ADP-heptose:LPS heptosyltransferase